MRKLVAELKFGHLGGWFRSLGGPPRLGLEIDLLETNHAGCHIVDLLSPQIGDVERVENVEVVWQLRWRNAILIACSD